MAAWEEEDFAQELLLELGEADDGPCGASSPSDESSAEIQKGSADATNLCGAADVRHGSSPPQASSDASAPTKRQKLGQQEGEPQPAQEPTRAQGHLRVVGQASPLSQLTPDVLLRVMCFLSPEDLSTLGRVSRLFSTATNDTSLWRRLYYMRCGGRLLSC